MKEKKKYTKPVLKKHDEVKKVKAQLASPILP